VCSSDLPDIGGIVVLVVIIPDGLYHGFPKGGLVGSALGGVLPVDKGVVFLTVLGLTVGHGQFDVLPLEVDHRIEKIVQVVVVLQKVLQSVFGMEPFPVEQYG